MNNALLQNISLLIARVLTSAFMIPHGWSKLNRVLEGNFDFPDPLGIGAKASLICTAGTEFFASILLLIGLFSRISSATLLFTMLVAGLVHHWPDPWDDKEGSLMYAVVYLLLMVFGAGKFSADYLIKTYLLKK
jgi:putative oxidoreductase